jgi:hypothetical protein
MGAVKNVFKILVKKPEGKKQLEDLGIDGVMILIKCFLKKWCEQDSSGSG